MTPSEVRRERLRRGITQREAARVAGVHVRTWQKYEAGECRISKRAWRLFQIGEGK